MKMKIIGKFLLLIAIDFCLLFSAKAGELNGIVKSEEGKPLAGVQILTYALLDEKAEFLGMQMTMKRYEATTDLNGFFKLPSHGQIVYFKRQDLRPLTKILNLSAKQIEVMMEDGARSLWKIPSCSSVSDKSKRIGIGFMIIVPENVMVRKDNGHFEDGGYFFGYDSGGHIEAMISWWESTSLEPAEKQLFESKEFSERMWVSGKISGYEFRGVKSDGKLWRRISLRNGAITYQGNTKESAEVFDRLIDNMCFDESAVKW